MSTQCEGLKGRRRCVPRFARVPAPPEGSTRKNKTAPSGHSDGAEWRRREWAAVGLRPILARLVGGQEDLARTFGLLGSNPRSVQRFTRSVRTHAPRGSPRLPPPETSLTSKHRKL